MYAGVQLVMPGEIAPAHRHTQSALRFVLLTNRDMNGVAIDEVLSPPIVGSLAVSSAPYNPAGIT
jgi:hypothetical protein